VQLILASASPRRADLLRAARIPFRVRPSEIDETPHLDELPHVYVERMAREKAQAVARDEPGGLVLGADTAVVIDTRILGKPRDREDAIAMLRQLSGRAHVVVTGIALYSVAATRLETAVERTVVHMALLAADEILAYVDTGEPLDKAGAYGAQGVASRYIERVEGSYTNVVGLPVATVYALLRRLGTVPTDARSIDARSI
jgi:septum formation protein